MALQALLRFLGLRKNKDEKKTGQFVYLNVCLNICPSVGLRALSVRLSDCVPICLSVGLRAYLSVGLLSLIHI